MIYMKTLRELQTASIKKHSAPFFVYTIDEVSCPAYIIIVPVCEEYVLIPLYKMLQVNLSISSN